MTLDSLVRSWIEASARVLASVAGSRNSTVAIDGELYRLRGADGRERGAWPRAGSPDQALVARTRGARLVLRLPAQSAVVRSLDLPEAGRPYAREIARGRLDRLSPWPADKVAFAVTGTGHAEGPVPVALILVPDDTIAAHVAALARHGLTIRAVETLVEGVAVPLERPRAEARDDLAPPAWARWAAAGAAVLVVTSTLAASLTLTLAARAAVEETAGWKAAIDTLRTRIAGPRTNDLASLGPEEAAWASRERAPSVVDLLEVVSRALPDDTSLTDWRFEDGLLRITGWTRSAPGLVPALEAVPGFTQARFFAPTVRAEDGRFRVHLEARVGRTGTGEAAP